jgi:hypothetical protein
MPHSARWRLGRYCIGWQDEVPPFTGGLIDEFTVGSFVVRRETLAAVVVAEFEQIQREATPACA